MYFTDFCPSKAWYLRLIEYLLDGSIELLEKFSTLSFSALQLYTEVTLRKRQLWMFQLQAEESGHSPDKTTEKLTHTRACHKRNQASGINL